MKAEQFCAFERRTDTAKVAKRGVRSAKIEKKRRHTGGPLRASLFALLIWAVVVQFISPAVGQSRQRPPKGRIVKIEPPLTEDDFAVPPRIATQARFERLERLPTGVPIVTIEVDDDATMAREAAKRALGGDVAGGDELFAGADAIVFSQASDAGYFLPLNSADAGSLEANLLMPAGGWDPAVPLNGFDFTVHNSSAGPSGPATVHAELWVGDPLGDFDVACGSPGPIAGTQCTFSELPDASTGPCSMSGTFTVAPCVGLHRLRCRFADPVPVPGGCDHVWLAWQATEGCRVGWRLSGSSLGSANDAPAQVGFSDGLEYVADCKMFSACNTVPNPGCANDASTNRNCGFCCDNAGPASGIPCDHTDGVNECPHTSFCSDGLAEMATAYTYQQYGMYASYLATLFAPARTAFALLPVGNQPDGSLDPGVTIQGNEIRMPSGGRRVYLEARIGDWDPDDVGKELISYRIGVEPASFINSFGGTLLPAVVPCATDAECVDAFGPGALCNNGASAGCQAIGASNCCNPTFVDQGRGGSNPYVFIVPSLCGALTDEFGMHFGCVKLTALHQPDPEPFPVGGLYAGTLVVDVPSDAMGTYVLGTDDPQTASGRIDQNHQNEEWIPLLGFVPAKLIIPCPAAPNPAVPIVATNRYLSFVPTNAGRETALRVTFEAMPPPYDVYNGRSMWVGPPEEISELAGVRSGVTPTFMTAGLQCDPLYRTWDGRCVANFCDGGLHDGFFCMSDATCRANLHVYHDLIVPGGRYVVQTASRECGGEIGDSFSPAQEAATTRWGDLAGAFEDGAWSPPDGRVNIVIDVTAIIGKFRNRLDAVSKTQADLDPALPNQLIDITDAVRAIDAFRGLAYPFAPTPWPCGGGT